MDALESLKIKLQEFADERDWEQFYSPKKCFRVLSVEASERPTEEEYRKLILADY